MITAVKRIVLFRDEPADVVELTGGAEEHVFIGDELGVFIHEDLPDRAQVEVFRVIAEVFAMDAGPDEAAVGIRRSSRSEELV